MISSKNLPGSLFMTSACRLSMSIATFLLLLSSAFYFIAKIVSHKARDYRQPVGADDDVREPLVADLNQVG